MFELSYIQGTKNLEDSKKSIFKFIQKFQESEFEYDVRSLNIKTVLDDQIITTLYKPLPIHNIYTFGGIILTVCLRSKHSGFV